MSLSIPESLLLAPKGSRIAWDPVIRSIVDGPKQDGSRETNDAIRRLLLQFREEYERQRSELGARVTTVTSGDDLVVLADSEALRENQRARRKHLRGFAAQAARTRAIERENLTEEERREHDRDLDRNSRTEEAIRRSRRSTPQMRPHVRSSP